MPYGFFVTDRGIEKIAKAAQAGGRVAVNTLAVGDGGDPEAERDCGRTSLAHETYRKTMDEMDTYDIVEEAPSVVRLVVVVPDEAGAMTVNELGFYDSEGDLIVYGLVQETFKAEGANGSIQTLEVTCYIDFVNTGLEYVDIVVGSDGLVLLQGRVDVLEGRVTANEGSIEGILADLKTYVKKREGFDLSSNDFSQAWIDQINANKRSIQSNITLINEKADRADLDNKVDKVRGKGLSTYDFTDSYRSQIGTNRDDIASLKSRVSALSDSIDDSASSGDLSDLKRRVSALESQLSGLASRMSEVAYDLERMR